MSICLFADNGVELETLLCLLVYCLSKIEEELNELRDEDKIIISEEFRICILKMKSWYWWVVSSMTQYILNIVK